jgi:hypothetical protein
MTLAYSGCRLSEALALTAGQVALAAGALVFESLKKHRSEIFRSVTVPPPCSIPSAWCTASATPSKAQQRPRRVALAVVADDRMASGACGDSGCGARGGAGLAQGAAAWFWGGRRHCRHSAQPRAEMAWPRLTQHHRGVCQCRRRGGEGYRSVHVELTARQNGAGRMRGPAGCAICRS